MKTKTNWLVRTALLLALLIALQWVTKPLGQLVTGSCVNGVLAVAALLAGLGSGITVALLSPIFAFLLGIAPNPVTVPVIMLGNALFVLLLRKIRPTAAAWLTAAAAKFILLYLLVTVVICGIAADSLLAVGVLKAPMLQVLPAAFSWVQLVTALIGGGLAVAICPKLEKFL